MPEKDPERNKKQFPIPWPKYATLRNIQRVAQWWCAGDCEKARRLPPSLFNEVLTCAIADERGKQIADEETAKELERQRRLKQ